MNTFSLRITSPDGSLYDGQASFISLRGADGDLAIMADHIPFITSVKPCKCKVIFANGTEKIGTTEGGMLSVADNRVTLLSSSFAWES